MVKATGLENDMYWIEEIQDRSYDDNGNDSIRIILSCEKHGACIEVLGSNISATNRAVRIIQALNDIK